MEGVEDAKTKKSLKRQSGDALKPVTEAIWMKACQNDKSSIHK